MKKVFIRSPYNYDRNEASKACAYHETMPSLTVQDQKDDADINVIVRRFGLTGVMPVNHRVPEYGDFTHVQDYQSAVNAIVAAHDHFMEMPAEVRSEFGNDPQRFMEFCHNPASLPRMRELGLAIPEKIVQASPVVVPTESK